MPVIVSSTTVDRSASSAWSAIDAGWIRLENCLANTLISGSAINAAMASLQLVSTRIVVTATIVMMFEIVIGIITRNWFTAWMSVAERAISCPVWAWSWKAK